MMPIILLLIGWFYAAFYSFTVIAWGCKIGLVFAVLNYIRKKHQQYMAQAPEREKRRARREAQQQDWSYDGAYTTYDSERNYLYVVRKRNPARRRVPEFYYDSRLHDAFCGICGNLLPAKRQSSLEICDSCHELYDYATFRTKIPAELPEDSAYLVWTRQMIAATDYEDGVISKDELERELKFVVALECEKVKERARGDQIRAAREREQQRLEEQKRNNVTAANRLIR